MSNYQKFYLKTTKERIDLLIKDGLYRASFDQILTLDDANLLSENVISTFELPFSVVPNLIVNQKSYFIPIVTEEPSVVAALSHATKIIGPEGFKSHVHNRLMIGQIFFEPIHQYANLEILLQEHTKKIFTVAQNSHPSIAKRGGGLKDFKLVIHSDNDQSYPVLYLYIDTLEAMGANIVNTILEGVASYLKSINIPVLMAILSNLSTESLVTSSCEIPFDRLTGGIKTAEKIALASTYSKLDIYRAVTHNKGILNGIGGLFLATGNDTRAIEAACHGYASLDGYQPLSTWRIMDDKLIGHLTIPCAVGSVGRQMNTLNKAQLAHHILGYPTARDLMQISAAVGLAQNFSALYALVTTGIQKGHMSLHQKTPSSKE